MYRVSYTFEGLQINKYFRDKWKADLQAVLVKMKNPDSIIVTETF